MALRIVVIGGGISGLSLGYLLSQKKEYDVIVFEAQKRAGGKIWTERHNSFIVEGGVNAFLDNRAPTLELIKRLSLSPLRSSGLGVLIICGWRRFGVC
jgi:oxygen-dependent protoporphyrinogen oxidase